MGELFNKLIDGVEMEARAQLDARVRDEVGAQLSAAYDEALKSRKHGKAALRLWIEDIKVELPRKYYEKYGEPLTEIPPDALKQVADKASAALLDAQAKYRYPRSDDSNLSVGEIEAAEARWEQEQANLRASHSSLKGQGKASGKAKRKGNGKGPYGRR